MAYESGHRSARRADSARLARAAGVAVVAGVVPASLDAGPRTPCFGGDDASHGLLANDRSTFVSSDIAARCRNLPQRSQALDQTHYLAALLAPLSGSEAPGHATALLTRFGSIAGVTAARTRELAEVFGAESPLPACIAAVRRLLHAGLREEVVRKPLDPADPNLRRYVSAHFSGLRHEEMLALFGDGGGRFLDHQTLAAGSSERIEFSSPVLFRRATAIGAEQVLLAHNHPSGEATPSNADLVATRRVARDGALLGIVLLDHLIVAGSAVFSMKQAGLL